MLGFELKKLSISLVRKVVPGLLYTALSLISCTSKTVCIKIFSIVSLCLNVIIGDFRMD